MDYAHFPLCCTGWIQSFRAAQRDFPFSLIISDSIWSLFPDLTEDGPSLHIHEKSIREIDQIELIPRDASLFELVYLCL